MTKRRTAIAQVLALLTSMVSLSALRLQAADNDSAKIAELSILQSKLEAVQREQMLLREGVEKRIESNVEATNRRIDDLSKTLQLTFWLLGGFGTLGGLFAYTSWNKGRQDYQREREFYEKRMHDIDKNNRETYQHEREFFEKRASGADQNQHALVSQQLSMGATVLSRTDNMLAQQIEGITKLGAVIELVRDSFDLQLKRETDLKQITKLLDDFNGHYRNAYRNMAERTLSLKVSRMGWTSLSLAQAELAAGARAEFRSIPESVLTESEKASPYEFAKVCQLVGTSSFYANDVGFADRLLRRARDGYRAQPFREDHRDPMAAASFFLGLVAKSWIEENRRLEDGLGDAKRCLEEAQDLLKSNKGEFLVPITLCEVLSYIQNDRRRAADALAGHIDVMSALETPDENQQKLLVRAHLLKGNLAKAEVAIASYREAQRLDPKNPYATLSIAMLTEDVDKREQGFRLGLSALRENKSLEKTEMTTRATAIVWAAVACHEVHDDKGLEVQLKTSDRLEAGTISTGGRVPLFFCPITKTLCRFDALRENLKAQLKPSAT